MAATPQQCSMALLIAGGDADPQLQHLRARAEARGVAVRGLLHGADKAPRVDWRLDNGTFEIDGEALSVGAAFIRRDVFRALETKSSLDHATARNWKMLLDGWLAAHPQVRAFNRGFLMRDEVNKPLALIWARECGLKIPRTRMTDRADLMRQWLKKERVAYKPVAGGDLCRELTEDALDRAGGEHLPRPYTFQQRLVAPEYRVFRVGESFHAYEVASQQLDYRGNAGRPQLTPVAPPSHLLEPLRALTDRLGLDWTAADFKTCADTGELLFLETNSNPMFAAFDKASDGALTGAMIDWLTAENG